MIHHRSKAHTKENIQTKSKSKSLSNINVPRRWPPGFLPRGDERSSRLSAIEAAALAVTIIRTAPARTLRFLKVSWGTLLQSLLARCSDLWPPVRGSVIRILTALAGQ